MNGEIPVAGSVLAAGTERNSSEIRGRWRMQPGLMFVSREAGEIADLRL